MEVKIFLLRLISQIVQKCYLLGLSLEGTNKENVYSVNILLCI